MIRVLVVAASPVVRMGLEALLARSATVTVLGAAGDLAQLTDLVEASEPDVVLLALDPGAPVPPPMALSPDAAGRMPALVVLGDEPVAEWGMRALQQGARGALPRTAIPAEIHAAIEAAAAGLAVLPPEALRTLQPRAIRSSAGPVAPLTPREIEILALLAEGLGNKVAAARLGISEHTVKTHVESLFAKLGVTTRTEAVMTGARLGLIML
jgi:two-component system, NarL family, response regulator YdfI